MADEPRYFVPTSASAKLEISAMKAAIQARIPYYLEGPPGNGKSSIIRAVAHSLGYEVYTVTASQMHATEVAGLPIVNNTDPENPTTVKAMPDWFRYCIKRPKTVVFLDEWNHTPPATAAPFQVILQERVLNNVPIPDETVFMMAGNPLDSSSAGRPLTQPIANRMVHRSYSPDPEDWFEGMACGWNEPQSERLAAERTRIMTFLHSPENIDLLDKGPRSEVERSGAHPTRRSWDNLARILAETEPVDGVLNDDVRAANQTVRDVLTQATVGVEAFAQFGAWDAGFNLPDLDAVMEDPTGFDWEHEDVDKVYAVLSLIAATRRDAEHAAGVAAVFLEAGRAGKRLDIGAGLVSSIIPTIKLDPDINSRDMVNQLVQMYMSVLVDSGVSMAPSK